MNIFERLSCVAVVCAVLAPPAAASLDIAFGANVPVGDDGRLFLSISSRYFERDVRVVEDWARRFTTPDDLAVAMFLGRQCNQDAAWFVSMRKAGLGWFEIGQRCRVQPDVWFVPVAVHPGPPYGKAYGHWKKHKQNPRTALVLSDADVRNLMAVRMIHEYYGVPVETAMQLRSTGRDVRTLMASEYHGRHGHGPNKGKTASAKSGKGRSVDSHGKSKQH